MDKQNKLETRVDQIMDLANFYYNNYPCLHYESIDIFVNKAVSMFIESKLSMKEISNLLFDIITEKDFYASGKSYFIYDDDGKYKFYSKKK